MIRYNNNWFSSRCALNELAMYERVSEREGDREYNPNAKKYFVCIALLHMCAQQKDLIICNVAKHFSKEPFYMCLSKNDGQKNYFKVAHDFCSLQIPRQMPHKRK